MAVQTLVMEHKTTSEDIGVGSMYWSKLSLDAQISNYLVGAHSLGYSPDGALYDVLRKPGLRPLEVNSRRSEPEAPEAYRDRCMDAITANPDHYYQRGVVVRLESERVEAAYDAWQTADAIRFAQNNNIWPRNVDSCSAFGSVCDYWKACSGECDASDVSQYEQRQTAHSELSPESQSKSHLRLFTTSSARAYRSCPRKYMYSYHMGIKPRAQTGARAFGRLVHTGLEALLKGGYDINAAVSTMLGERYYDAGHYNYDMAKAEAMLRGYHARWSGDALEVLAVEVEFVTPLINPNTGAASRTFARAGKIDAIVRRDST